MLLLYLFFHELIHAASYLLIIFAVSRLIKIKIDMLKHVLLGLAVTILMDLDHFVDYFIYKKSLSINLWEFLTTNFFYINGKTYLLLHAWEWVALLLLAYLVSKRRYTPILFIALGVATQLLVDSLSYGFDWRVYFITFRWLNNFDQAIFYLPGS